MFKNFLYIFMAFIIFVTPMSNAQEVYTINSVNLDTSNSLLFLGSPDTASSTVLKNIKLVKLDNPKRVYFDIENSVLAMSQQNWFLNSGDIKQVRICQFSINPHKVRIVLYLKENYNPTNLSFYRINNNIVIKLKNDTICKENYFQTVYKDDRTSSSEFYENLSISNEDFANYNSAAKKLENNEVINQIQNSFNNNPKNNTETQNAIIKKLRLKSRYYLNTITAKENGFLISGFGALTIERPMILASPSRIVYDIPNAIINPELKNKEYKIFEDTIKVSQFSQNKTRIVITTMDTSKYLPLFSSDAQSIFFSKESSIDLMSLFNKTNDIVSYNVLKKKNIENNLVLAFNSPVVFSVKRSPTVLTVYLYNTLRYNEGNFIEAVKNSAFENIKIDLLPKVGVKLTIPIDRTYISYCSLGADGKALKISLKGNIIPPTSQSKAQSLVLLPASPFMQKYKGAKSKKVVLDAGHGGTDYGAIREGINEKDINLDITKRVQAILQSRGIKVYTTRGTDTYVSLQKRTEFTEEVSPEIFVSVHVNSSSKPEIYGIETHYFHDSSLELANTLHSKMINSINSKDRGVFRSKFYVINHTTVPAVLLEIGFLSNADERAELLSEQRKQKTAKAIAAGILKYLNDN